jgi:mannose/fructose/N-acetylgalactosamine-specific phosphotransferase system component IID
MKEYLVKLLKVKSVVTIVLTAVFAYLAITGEITGEQFIVIFTTVIAFYFGTQTEKKKEGE